MTDHVLNLPDIIVFTHSYSKDIAEVLKKTNKACSERGKSELSIF